MLDFWNDWAVRWPDNSTSKGPLCDIYYHYGIDEDWFNPWGSITVNGGATYTNSRTVTLTLDGEDWGVGVQYMRFSEDYGNTFGSWYSYTPTFTYTIASANDGWKYIDVQYADFWWLSKAGTIYDGIGLDTANPSGTIKIQNGTAYTTSRSIYLNLTSSDNYSGVHYMRFSENMGAWGAWVPFATVYSYTLTTPNDGTKSIDVQVQDYANNNSTQWGTWDYIYLDTTLPNGTMLINNGSIATTSTSVYLNLTWADTGSGVSKIRFGNTGDPWSAWETPTPTKAWTIPSGDGTKYVWAQVIDNAGLISDQFYDQIFLDTTAPTGSITVGSGNPTYATLTSVTLYLSYADSSSGVYQVRYGNSGGSWSDWEAPAATKAWTLISGDGSKTVWYQVMDNAGLLSTMYSDDIILDTAAPTASIVIGSGNPTYTTTSAVTLYLTYSDSGSGVYQVRYGNSGQSWSAWGAPATTKAWTLSTGDGTKTVYYQVMDNAELITQASDSIILDTIAPVGSISINSGSTYTTSQSVTLSLTYSDATSGAYQIRFSNDGIWDTEQWEALSATKAWTLTGGDGTKKVFYEIKDNAGLISVPFDDTIILDTTIPTGSIIIGSGNPTNTTTTAVTLYLTYSDATSGVNQVRYSNDGAFDTEPWEAAAATKAWTLTSGAGLKTVYYQIKDNAGLLSAMYSDDITLTQTFGLKNMATWYWTSNTVINSQASGDVDGDGLKEIVTGGYYNDGTRNVAQLIEWNGATLAADRLTTWYWTSNTAINSVAVGDVDADGQVEVVTGGYFNDGTRNVAQLIEWNGANLAADRLTSWYWTSNTVINSVAVGDADGDGLVEVVTGGYFNDGTRDNAQLIEWNGANLAADRLTTWYWTSNTAINSVALGDVDADGLVEVVSGGYYNDGVRNVAQLIEWNGANLAVDKLNSWYWTNNTVINCVSVGDVTNDGSVEIVTGGYFNDGTRNISQLTVWGMT